MWLQVQISLRAGVQMAVEAAAQTEDGAAAEAGLHVLCKVAASCPPARGALVDCGCLEVAVAQLSSGEGDASVRIFLLLAFRSLLIIACTITQA
jgi:hypothetical protein